jgi:hypothetical protein
LAENDGERERVAGTMCDTADYLIRGDLKFIDPVTNVGTHWGYWDPEQLNGIPGKPNERGENSLEVLGFMAAAAKICPNSTKYSDVFVDLVRNHQYDVNVINAMATSPQSLAFFDFRLAFMSFHTLTLAVPGKSFDLFFLDRASSDIPLHVLLFFSLQTLCWPTELVTIL